MHRARLVDMQPPKREIPIHCPLCGVRQGIPDGPLGGRGSYFVLTSLGLILAVTGSYIATRTLPRYAALTAAYHLNLPNETLWVLRNGWLQPIPGCLLTIGGLGGVLRQRSGAVLLVATVVTVLAGIAILLLDWAVLLLPDLVLV